MINIINTRTETLGFHLFCHSRQREKYDMLTVVQTMKEKYFRIFAK